MGGISVALAGLTLSSLLLRWWLPTTAAVAVVIATLVVAVSRDAGLIRVPLPQNARQVPEAIARSGPVLGALQFGAEMGTGMRTFMTTALPHVVLVVVLLLASPGQAIAAGIGFAAGRGLVPLGTWATGLEWTETFDRWRRLVVVAMYAGVVAALWTICGPLIA